MFRHLTSVLALGAVLTLASFAQDSSNQNKNLDIRSSAGDLHIGSDADARKIGLPLYPGARLKSDDQNKNQANLSILTEAFGMTLIVAGYDSDDAPAKILDFYRDKLKKYGKVLECHSPDHSGGVDVDDDDKDAKGTKDLQCEHDSGPVTELKAGTQENQRVVAVKPGTGKGSSFSLIWVRTRGKQGEI